MERSENLPVFRVVFANEVFKKVFELGKLRTQSAERERIRFSFRTERRKPSKDCRRAYVPIEKRFLFPDDGRYFVPVESFHNERLLRFEKPLPSGGRGGNLRFEVRPVVRVSGEPLEYFIREHYGNGFQNEPFFQFRKGRSIFAVVPSRVREQFVGVGNLFYGFFRKHGRGWEIRSS